MTATGGCPDVAVPDEARLLALQQSERRRLEALTRDVEQIIEAADATNTDDEHDPDGTTVAFERALATGLRERSRAELLEIEAAIEALASGTYGRCARCGAPIAHARLQALPATRTCFSCAADPEAARRERSIP